MRRIMRNVAHWVDHCVRRRTLSTLACLIAFWFTAEFVVLRGINAFYGAIQQVTVGPAASRPADDVASRLERIERRLDEMGTVIARIRP